MHPEIAKQTTVVDRIRKAGVNVESVKGKLDSMSLPRIWYVEQMVSLFQDVGFVMRTLPTRTPDGNVRQFGRFESDDYIVLVDPTRFKCTAKFFKKS